MSDTIVAVSTPPGAGGIAVVRVSGADAFRVAARCFAASAKTPPPPPRQAIYGKWRDPSTEQVIDDVLVTAFHAPHSYTGEHTVEISCHGSTFIQSALLESCTLAGATLAEAGEFTRRAFVNGKLDLTQAEGVGDLIASETAAAHRLARTQLGGAITRAMAELRGELIEFAALLELENDFGEEDVAFADVPALQSRVSALRTEIQRLLASFRVGQAIKKGVTTVIAGRPNAGKSTLLNLLLGEDRAIVSQVAGTTRDTLDAQLVIDGVAFRLIDTAGIREATDEVEALGVARTLAEVKRAAVLVYVWDVVMTSPEEVAADIASLQGPGVELVAVANKMDLNPYARFEHYADSGIVPDRFVPMSAANAMNLGKLQETIFAAGVGELPAIGDAVLTQARHVAALRESDEALARVEVGIATGVGGDLVALDLRQALHYVGEVTGQIGVDDLLDSIFSSFCIGK